MRHFAGLLLFSLTLLAQTNEIRLDAVVTGLASPVDIQSPRDGTGRLFIVQQAGLIRTLRNGQLTTFLDITGKTARNGECGLLGLAFPPDFTAKRHFYVYYTDTQCRNSVLSRYALSQDNTADAASERVLLRVAQPFTNHNGGRLQFGPDGYLYAGFGDGGSGGDPQNNGQNPRAFLGKILRLDVESADDYRVPPSNPYVGNSAFLPEIWALGLRNPWRFSFDRQTKDLWIADVGQDRAEEINFQPASSPGGENYGWHIMEGFRCLSNPCNSTGTTLPVLEYTRGQGDISVTGGFVYRGPLSSTLTGTYIYADYVTGRIWGIDSNLQNRLLLDSPITISAFGEDEDGTLYLADYSGGRLMRIVPLNESKSALVSVVNGASFLPGLAPGAAASAFLRTALTREGIDTANALPLPRDLVGVSVLVNGREAPLYATAKTDRVEQVNFQVPFETASGMATVRVKVDGATYDLAQVPVAATNPGIFMNEGIAVAVHNADNSLVTDARPLAAGELAYFYATGLGATANQPETGAGASLTSLSSATARVTVTLAGQACEVLFAGLAPGLAGVYQVNIRIPSGVSAGSPHLVVTQGTQASRPVPLPLR